MLRSVSSSVVPGLVALAVAIAPVAQAADPRDVRVKSRGKTEAAPAEPEAGADAKGGDGLATRRGVPREWLANTDMFSVRRRPEKARSAFWFPLICFVVPGFDQWWEGQFVPAIAYTGTAAAGYGYIDYLKNQNGIYERDRAKRLAIKNGDEDPTDKKADELDSKDSITRKMALAGQISQWSGGMSTYHSFRTAVRTRKQFGEYQFITAEETPFDIMAAPFHVEYLLRPTTFIPLAVIAGLSLLSLRQPLGKDSDLVRDKVSGEDAFYAGAFSYNAGTHEEAVFRGWLQPWLMEQWGSPFWSNATQSLVFGAAHLNTNPLPIIQILLGYHLGWVSQRNGYRIGEGVFIHAWWDVVAFVASYNYKQKPTGALNNLRLARPVLWLPPLELAF